MIVWLKFIHVAAIAIWCGGLISLPALFVQRRHAGSGDVLVSLERQIRYAYIVFISPAAFVGVASGTVLIFVAETYAPWFHLKMLLVGMLVVAHVLTGLVIVKLFEKEATFPSWRFILVTSAIGLVIVGILWVVLAKPEIDYGFLAGGVMEPGALRDQLLRSFPDLGRWL